MSIFGTIVTTVNRNQEICETMLKACEAKYSVPVRYGKVLFCGASAAGKSNFSSLLLKEDFQSMHISTEVLKPTQVTVAMKALVSSNNGEVEFQKMSTDDEILHLESFLPVNYNASILKSLRSDSSTLLVSSQDPEPNSKVPGEKPMFQPKSSIKSEVNIHDTTTEKLSLANLNSEAKKLPKRPLGEVLSMLTFMDTGGQPQFISLLPAVNSFAMITFIVHKMVPGGQKSLNEIVNVQFGNENGETSFTLHPHKYTYIQLTETLISYASQIILPDNKFLNKLKCKNAKTAGSRSIVLVGTHSGSDDLSEDDINEIDKGLSKVVEQSGVNHVKPKLNNNYKNLVPVDNKKQSKKSESQGFSMDPKRYTESSVLRAYIKRMLDNQEEIYVPIKWLLLELEIRKVCQEKNCNLISYNDVLRLAKDKKFGYAGEFDDDKFTSDEFIKQGLRFHHLFGVLLYFEDVKGMKEIVITNHQWLFNKLSKIVQCSFTQVFDTQEDFHNFNEKGIFNKTLLDSDCLNIYKDFKDSGINIDSFNPIEAFLRLLQYLQIAAPLNEDAEQYFMPCILKSCELSELKQKNPDMQNKIEPLLIQFKSYDDKTYSFPRGAFCFLIVELMLSRKWELHGQSYVNLITLIKKETAHHITLIDRIFCLEVHVTHPHKKDHNICSEILENVNKALHTVAEKLHIHNNLCHGFLCSCEETHIAYLTEDSDHYCYCLKRSSIVLTDAHRVWLKKVYVYLATCMYPIHNRQVCYRSVTNELLV